MNHITTADAAHKFLEKMGSHAWVALKSFDVYQSMGCSITSSLEQAQRELICHFELEASTEWIEPVCVEAI